LQGRKSPLEKSVVDYIGFAVLALHDPVAFGHIAETRVGGNRFALFALRGVYDERS
jgi:hypothetical protein